MNIVSGLEVSGSTAGFIDGVDLVVVRWDDQHSVLSGRCRHRGALLADGHVAGANLIGGNATRPLHLQIPIFVSTLT